MIACRTLFYICIYQNVSRIRETKIVIKISNMSCHEYPLNITQGIRKRMVRFQKLTRNLFLTLHGHNAHRQQRRLSKFLMRYQ